VLKMTTAPDPDFDLATMRIALEEARKAQPSPNPPVGAVVVGETGEIVAAAYHARAGDDHAEVAALRRAGEAARGGTLFVTLEPCNHHGRTPPCVDTIVRSGVRRVVIGCNDPNPNVEGGGANKLVQEGLSVEVGVAGPDARALIAPWAKYITSGMPYVSLKLALSLDGRIATRSGASKWVTGPEARAKVQELRAQHDAVAVGIGTAIADDPRLTVRTPGLSEQGRTPTRIVFDTHLRLPQNSRLVQTSRDVATWVLTGQDAPEAQERALVEAGCIVMRVPNSAEGRVDVAAALRILAAQNVVSILVEGGAELAGSLLAARLADELHAFIAPILLGPRGRPGAVDWAGPDTPSDAPRILDPRWALCGRDAYVSGPLSFPTPR
jgi:diaminohydroxyphosphoribosylaminopyrimidine deaminase / 5-amino-6-(5-phosphoribosylamino)uracil reductase